MNGLGYEVLPADVLLKNKISRKDRKGCEETKRLYETGQIEGLSVKHLLDTVGC
jgi:hypothetical protein